MSQDQEAEIQAYLASQLAVKNTPDPTPPPVTETPEAPDDPAPTGMTPENELEKMKLFDYFEVSSADRHSVEAQQYLQSVVDWARDETGSSDYLDIIRAISDQERVLGIKLQPNRLSRLHRFALIRSQRIRLAEEERALYA